MVFYSTSFGRSKTNRGCRIKGPSKNKYLLDVEPNLIRLFDAQSLVHFRVSTQKWNSSQEAIFSPKSTYETFRCINHDQFQFQTVHVASILKYYELIFHLFISYSFIFPGSSVQTTCVLLRRCGVTCGGGLKTLVTTKEDHINSSCVEHESTNSKFNQKNYTHCVPILCILCLAILS